MRNKVLAETKIIRIISKETEKSISSIEVSDRFEKDLRMDSLDVITVCANVELELGVSVSDREIGALKTVGDLLKLVEERLSDRI